MARSPTAGRHTVPPEHEIRSDPGLPLPCQLEFVVTPTIGVRRLAPLICAFRIVARPAGRGALAIQPGEHGGLAYFGQGNGKQALRPFRVREWAAFYLVLSLPRWARGRADRSAPIIR